MPIADIKNERGDRDERHNTVWRDLYVSTETVSARGDWTFEYSIARQAFHTRAGPSYHFVGKKWQGIAATSQEAVYQTPWSRHPTGKWRVITKPQSAVCHLQRSHRYFREPGVYAPSVHEVHDNTSLAFDLTSARKNSIFRLFYACSMSPRRPRM